MSNDGHKPVKTTTEHLASALWHINKAQDVAINTYPYDLYQPFRERLHNRYDDLLAILRVLQHQQHTQNKS